MRKFIYFIALLSVFLLPVTTRAQGLVINEMMSANVTTIADEDGDFSDWIELYNGTNDTINLAGYTLSDKLSQPAKWTFTEHLLYPNTYLLVFASGKDRQGLPYFHTNFSIKDEGEDVLLSNPQGEIISHYNPVPLTDDNSYGCRTDGNTSNMVFFLGATPGNTNNHQPLISSQGFVINEMMSANATTITDEDGDYSDWIELYNGTNDTINLAGYTLSDKLSQPAKWTFTDYSFYPGAYLVVFASGKDRHTLPFHTNFSIKDEGEDVLLSNPQGEIISHYNPVPLTDDNSYGYRTDGDTSVLVFFLGATPGNTNNNQPLLNLTDSLIFSQPQGFYTQEFELTISHTLPWTTMHYTLDGSDPTPQSPVYTAPILIQNRQNEPNGISMIPTNPLDTPFQWDVWKAPQGNVFKANVLKVRSFNDTVASSEIETQSYFVHPDIFSKYPNFSVASLITDTANLFNYYTGIYVPGYYHDIDTSWALWYGTGNYHQRGDEWERPGNLSFFETDGTLAFQQNVGIRINGGGSRVFPQKALRIYAKDTYGQSYISYKLFPDKEVNKYKRFILSNNGQDFFNSTINDVLSYYIIKDLNLEVQSYRPSVLFINGEYWGVHSIRDRLDKYYLEYTRNIDPDNVDVIENYKEIQEGDTMQYTAMLDYVKNHDITQQSVFDSISSMINIDKYIDYNICKQYLATGDWPGNNVTCWKERPSGHKWCWMVYDNNFAFLNYDENTIEISTAVSGPPWPNPDWSTFLLRTLLQNDTFRQKYLQRFEYHLLNTFSTNRVLHYIDSLSALVSPVLPEHIARWNYPQDINYYQWNIDRMRLFANERPCKMRQFIMSYFNITDTTYAAGLCDNAGITEPPINTTHVYAIGNEINIDLPAEISGNLFIYNVMGQQVGFEKIGGKMHYHYHIDGTKGCYIVRLISNNNAYSWKVVLPD